MTLKCPKSISVPDPYYPYGSETRFCPYLHFPCVLETGNSDKCVIATALLKTRIILPQVFDDTSEVRDVVADYDMAAEEIVRFLFERMTTEELYRFLG